MSTFPSVSTGQSVAPDLCGAPEICSPQHPGAGWWLIQTLNDGKGQAEAHVWSSSIVIVNYWSQDLWGGVPRVPLCTAPGSPSSQLSRWLLATCCVCYQKNPTLAVAALQLLNVHWLTLKSIDVSRLVICMPDKVFPASFSHCNTQKSVQWCSFLLFHDIIISRNTQHNSFRAINDHMLA